MLYSEIKHGVLSLINQYSIVGDPIAQTYNNQADYLNRIPLLVNMGLVNIRTSVNPDVVLYDLNVEEGEEYGDMLRFKLPPDFYGLKTGGVVRIHHDHLERTNRYVLQGKKYILIPKKTKCTYSLEYYKYPEQLPMKPDDDYEFEEDIEVLNAAIVYAAAQLVMYDDSYQYASLYNDYESRLERMRPVQEAEIHPVTDVYGLEYGGWLNG